MTGRQGIPLTCREVIGILAEYLETALAPEVVRAFEEHLEDCAECVAYVNTYKKTRELTRGAGQIEMPAEIRARLRRFLRDEQGGRGGE